MYREALGRIMNLSQVGKGRNLHQRARPTRCRKCSIISSSHTEASELALISSYSDIEYVRITRAPPKSTDGSACIRHLLGAGHLLLPKYRFYALACPATAIPLLETTARWDTSGRNTAGRGAMTY